MEDDRSSFSNFKGEVQLTEIVWNFAARSDVGDVASTEQTAANRDGFAGMI